MLQDLDMMIREVDDVKELGFDVPSVNKLDEAREELKTQIGKPLHATYERLRGRYKRAIVPVKDDTCLGCFIRLFQRSPKTIPTPRSFRKIPQISLEV